MTGPFERSADPATTEAVGERLAQHLEPGDLVLLEGDLAAGKTTLVRGLVRGLGGDADEVSSPSFVIVQSYACEHGRLRRLHHVDLYRLDDDRQELREIGLEELLSDREAAVAVEWPKPVVVERRPYASRCWEVRLEVAADDHRRIAVTGPFAG